MSTATVDQIFKDDERRSKLAASFKVNDLLKTYKQKYKANNENTGVFWDKQLMSHTSQLDTMGKDRIKDAAKQIQGSSKEILNIGIGRGNLEKLLKKTKPSLKLYGVDITKKQLDTLSKEIKGTFRRGTITKIPFNKQFDTVSALEVLEHLPPSQTFQALGEIKRVLKTNGLAILSVPVYEKYTSAFNPNKHMRRYTPDLFKAEIRLSGYKILQETHFYAFKNFYNLKKILAKYLLKHRWKPNVILIVAKKK